MSKRSSLTICLVLSFVLALVIADGSLMGQRGGPPGQAGGRYGPGPQPPAAAPAPAAQQPAAAPQPGAMLDFLGPIGDIPATAPLDRGTPQVRTTDTYYYDRSVEEMLPDEFISNPDSEFDWRQLKAWHVPPLLKNVKIIGPRRIKAGESVTFEAEVSDPTGTTGGATLSYYGPKGRRTTMQATFRPIVQGSTTLRGTVTTKRWAEPGIYRHIRFGINNEVRSAKAFFSDYHPAMRGQPLEIEILPNPDADVMGPDVHWLKIGSLNAPEGQVHTQPLQDPIPIYAKVTDNKSGVERVWVRINKRGSTRFQEIDLKPLVGQKDVYVAFLNMPKWWEGGEYQVMMILAEDKNDKDTRHFFSTNEMVAKAKVNITQDPAMVDNRPPHLVSVWVESERGTMGQPVTISAIVLDDKSGVGTVSAIFQSVPSYQNNARVILRKVTRPDVIQRAGQDAEANLFQGQLTTSVWQEPGRWELMRVVARDHANNYMDMLNQDFPEFGSVAVDFGGGMRLREKMLAQLGAKGAPPATTTAAREESAVAAAPASSPAPQPAAAGQPGKIRRVDMVPPHPPRGACLNCHEP